jgi:hypothetical protein
VTRLESLAALRERQFRLFFTGQLISLLVDAASFGASAFFLWRLRLPPHVNLPPQSFLSDLREGWHEFSSRTWVWVIVAAASLGNMMLSIFMVLSAFAAKESLGGPAAYTLILAGLAVGSLAGGVVALHVRSAHPLRPGTSLLGLNALPPELLALGASAGGIAAAGVLAGASNMIFNSLWETSLQQHVPSAALSRVSAYDWFGSLAFSPLGLLLAGPAVAFGLSTTLWIVVAGSLATAVLARVPRSVRRLPAGLVPA